MIHRVTINEAEAGLLYRQGRCERRLESGRHGVWGLDLRVVRIDMRRRLLTVGSQEVLTSDSVQLRISVMVAFGVTDPARAVNEFESYEHELHLATQLALRTAVGERGFDELIEGRLDLSERLAELVAEMAPDLGLRIEAVRLRDVMLPGRRSRRSPRCCRRVRRAAPHSSGRVASPRRCAASPPRPGHRTPRPGS